MGIVVAGGFNHGNVIKKDLASLCSALGIDFVGSMEVGGNTSYLLCKYVETCEFSQGTRPARSGEKVPSSSDTRSMIRPLLCHG